MKIEDLNLSSLKYFVDAVETGSISRSSQMNHVSRPAVSQAILRLGEWYGKKLLKHEKRSFELTPEGEDFYRQARLSLDALKLNFESREPVSKTFRLSCSASLLDLVMPSLKAPLRNAEGPMIKLGTTQKNLQDLRLREVNLAVAVDKNDSFDFKSHVFKTGQFRLSSHSGDFTDALITTEDRPETLSLLSYLAKKKIRFKTHIKVESWSEAGRLAQILQGTCLLPDYLEVRGLKPIPLRGWSASYSAKVFYRNSYELSELERDFLDGLKKT